MLIDASVLDALPDAFLLVDEGVLQWVSRGASKMLDAPAEALRGRTLRSLVAAGEIERLDMLDEQRLAGWSLPETCRVRFVRVSDAAVVDADVQTGALPGRGAQARIYCARDATENRRAEVLVGQLAEVGAGPECMVGAEAMLDAAAPIFTELGWTVAFTDVVEGGSITRKILAPEGDPIGAYGRTLIDKVTPFAQTPVLTEIARVGRAVFLPNLPSLQERPVSLATALSESMTRARLTRSAWCPVVRDGRVTHVLAVAGKDVSERDVVALSLFAARIGAAVRMRELQAALLHRERLAAIGEMAAVVAHEVRNPLAVIFNAVGGLRRVLGAPPDAASLLQVAWEEAERLKKLVDDLLELAHPKEPEVQAVELASIIREAAACVRRDSALPSTATSALELALADALPRVQADPIRLHRALVNLLTNAFQHVPPHGTVRVTAAPAGDAEVRITVGNDGEPIAPEVARRMFEPFVTTKATGTGLGLALVRRIVEEVGGRVEVDPGAAPITFSLWLRVTDRDGPRSRR